MTDLNKTTRRVTPDCPNCGGIGLIEISEWDWYKGKYHTCPKCNGTGKQFVAAEKKAKRKGKQ